MSAPQQLMPRDALDSRAFRHTMGLFATGVAVVAVAAGGRFHGMTANAIASVSLEPLQLLVCVQKSAHLMSYLADSAGFSVNILTEDQEDLSTYFANRWPHAQPPPFAFQLWEGTPRLEGALCSLACQTRQWLDGGDHWIVLGEVVGLSRGLAQARPLLYFQGRYGRLRG